MARTLSSALQTKANQQYGAEPLVVLKVFWPSGTRYYTDKAYTFGVNVCEPKILDLGAITTQQRSVSSSDVASTNVELDDTDNTIKNSVNRDLIAGTKCTLYQTFNGVSDTDALIILSGRIANDVAWSEGSRTLSFNIDTSFQVNELGYAPKRGDLANLSVDAEGKLWPIVFGSCVKVPAVQIYKEIYGSYPNDNIISLTAGSSFYVSGGEAFPQATSVKIRAKNGVCLQGTFAGNIFTVTTNNVPYHTNVAVAARVVADPDEHNPYVCWLTNDEYLLGKICYIASGSKVNICVKQIGKKCWFAKPWKITGANAVIELASTVIDETSHFKRASWPDFQNEYYNGTTWSPIGYYTTWYTTYAKDVTLLTGLQPTYIVNNAATSTIKGVYAYRTYNGKTLLEPVPSSYYTKYDSTTIGGKTVAALVLKNQLSDYVDQGWSDDIYVTLTSGLGSNTSDVIKYLLETYTEYTADATTFNAVKTKITNYPSNFALLNQRDVLDLVADIAYQARLAIRFSGSVARLYYLSETPAAIQNLTDDTVRQKTLNYGFTSIDDIVTKYVAAWKPDYVQDKDSEYTYKNNESVYGLKEEKRDFFIYNIESLVKLSANFWGNRLSNSWRTGSLATFLQALNLETFDCVRLLTTTLAVAGIRGEIKQISHDTLEDVINIDIEFASKSGQHSSGNIIEDTTYFTGGVTGSEPAPGDPTNGISEIDYAVKTDPKTTNTDTATTTKVALRFTNVPSKIVRGQPFSVTIKAYDDNGSIYVVNDTFNLTIEETTDTDGISPTSITLVNGSATLSLTATGGTTDTEAVLNVLGKVVGNVQYSTGISVGIPITSEPTLTWTLGQTAVARGGDFTVTLAGGLPSTAYAITLISQDAAEKLYNGASLVTTITTNGSGGYTATWKFKDGTIPLNSVTIVATHGGVPQNSPSILVLQAGGGADNLVVPAKVTAQHASLTNIVTCSLYPHGRTTEGGDITWTGVQVNILQISASSDKIPVNTWMLVVGTKKIPNTSVGDATDYNWYAQPAIWI